MNAAQDASDLLYGLSADEVRRGREQMRAALATVTARGADTWTGPLARLVDALFEVGRVDLCLARLVEGHADGLRILDQAGATAGDGVYGVWASRSAGTGVKAVPASGSGWHLCGELRFASGISLIDRALVPGWLDEDQHRLFDLPADAAEADVSTWQTTAMDASRSFTVTLDLAGPEPVGPANFYLDRPGFVVGGLCVAAVWAGGAQQVVDLVTTESRQFAPSAHRLRRIGVLEQALWQAGTAIRDTVEQVSTSSPGWEHSVAHARTAVANACDQVLDEAAKIVGPGGLSRGSRLARAVADLGIYVRQHHTDEVLERAGRRALDSHQVLG